MRLRAKFCLFCVSLIVAISSFSYADDGHVDVMSGSVRLMSGHPSISMSDEYVLIEMLSDKYRVTASFNFYNAGPSTTVAVGFPVDGSDEKLPFLSFKTWVDGKVVQTTDLPVEQDETGLDFYNSFKVKSVYFPENKTTNTVVIYEAPYGSSSNRREWISYDYSTGSSWNGPIGKAVFDIRFPEKTLLGFGVSDFGNSTPRIKHRAYGQMIFEICKFEPFPHNSFYLEFNKTAVCWNSNVREDPGGFGFCNSLLDSNAFAAAYPTLAVLRLRRNAVFAQQGRVFKDSDLTSYFFIMDWYKPSNEQKAASLSDKDKQRLKEIMDAEQAILSAKILPVPFIIPKD